MTSEPHLLDERLSVTRERLWPLDAALVALGGLILYVAATRLRWDDPRWQYNAWTYAIGTVLGVLIMAVVLHKLTGHRVQRSVQLGFLISLLVHLLLLMMAVYVVIPTRYWPDAFTGSEVVGKPIRKTVPEYIFQEQAESTQQADWTRPVDAATASPETEPTRALPPLDSSAANLQMPTAQPQPPAAELPPSLLQKQAPAAAQPSPVSAEAQLARRQPDVAPLVPSSIEVPEVPVAAEASLDLPDRQDPRVQRSEPAGAAAALPTTAAPLRPTAPEQQLRLRPARDLPRLGETAMPVRPGARRQQPAAVPPLGAAPAVPSYSIARRDPDADRLLQPQPTPATRASRTPGASLGLPGMVGPTESPIDVEISESAARQAAPAPTAGLPLIDAGQTARASGRAPRDLRNTPPLAAGPLQVIRAPSPTAVADAVDAPRDGPLPATSDGRARRDLDTSISPLQATAPLPLDVAAADGPAGLARRATPQPGLTTMPDVPNVSMDLAPPRRQRQPLGGPMAPAGSEVASVQSFERRTMRTAGGASPAPAGALGPQTEEAIERGLAYLASRQNRDGSWSLQGEGERVMLRSDTAATGMCLLAFQGAGYTHRRHQYADTVARGLQFLIDNQKQDGDLYRVEDPLSNQNVWLYSHAIAALAICEAYGMTQDPELRQPAQKAIDFIAASQHPQRGGWRYTPGNSSDTSVTGWMMMALKSGELSGLRVPDPVYEGIEHWLTLAQHRPGRGDRYRYNPYALDTPSQRHGRLPTPTMTSVGLLMRLYLGWRRDNPMVQSGAEYLLKNPPQIGTVEDPKRDTYYWYYATQVMFHMGGDHWQRWNAALNPLLVGSQQRSGALAGSWQPRTPVPDRWAPHGGRLYVTAMNLLSLEVYYRHLPIYEETAK